MSRQKLVFASEDDPRPIEYITEFIMLFYNAFQTFSWALVMYYVYLDYESGDLMG